MKRKKKKVTGEGGLGKGGDGTRNVGSDDGHLVLLAEVNDVLLAAPRDRLSLMVEILGHLTQVKLVPIQEEESSNQKG